MTILITPNFVLRRVARHLTAAITDESFTAAIVLTAEQARDAAEAFGVMAAMMQPEVDEYPEHERAASKADRDHQLAMEEAA